MREKLIDAIECLLNGNPMNIIIDNLTEVIESRFHLKLMKVLKPSIAFFLNPSQYVTGTDNTWNLFFEEGIDVINSKEVLKELKKALGTIGFSILKKDIVKNKGIIFTVTKDKK